MVGRSERNFFSNPPSSLVSTAGDGYFFFGPGEDVPPVGGTNVVIDSAGGGQLIVFRFVYRDIATIGKVVFTKGGTVVAGATANFGIYDANGNLLVDSGPFDCSAAGAAIQSKVPIVSKTLTPGILWYAQAATDSTVTSLRNITLWNPVVELNTNIVRQAIAAGPLTAGALPLLIGALTPVANRTPSAVLFES